MQLNMVNLNNKPFQMIKQDALNKLKRHIRTEHLISDSELFYSRLHKHIGSNLIFCSNGTPITDFFLIKYD